LINPTSNSFFEGTQCIGLFCSDTLKLSVEDTNILLWLWKWLIKNVNQKVQTVIATTVILWATSTEIITKDWPSFFSMFFQSKLIFWDYNEILKLDAKVHDTIFELGINWSYENSVPTDTVDKINKIIEKYKADWLLTWATSIQQWVKNRKVITMLMKINSSMKTLVSVWRVGQFDYSTTADTSWNWRDDWLIKIQFNTGIIQTLKYKYHCARFTTKCDAWLQNFTANMKKIWKDFWWWLKDSMAIIKDASKRFWYFMFNAEVSEQDQEKYDSEINQLYNSAWIDTSNTGFKVINRRWNVVDKLKKWITSFKEYIGEVQNNQEDKKEENELDKEKRKEANQKYWDDFKKESESKTVAGSIIKSQYERLKKIFDKWETTQSSENISQEYKDYFTNIVNDVLKNQEFDSTIIVVAWTRDITPNFNLILSNIQSIESMIWDKSTEWKIIKNLWTACENQCINQDWTCYAN
jgi:Sec-independent protein translocase protein TatA